MSGKGSLLAKLSGPLGTSLAWRTVFWAYVTTEHISFMWGTWHMFQARSLLYLIKLPDMVLHSTINQTLLQIKLHIYLHTLTMGDFNTELSPMDRLSRQKLKREITKLTDSITCIFFVFLFGVLLIYWSGSLHFDYCFFQDYWDFSFPVTFTRRIWVWCWNIGTGEMCCWLSLVDPVLLV